MHEEIICLLLDQLYSSNKYREIYASLSTHQMQLQKANNLLSYNLNANQFPTLSSSILTQSSYTDTMVTNAPYRQRKLN